MVKFSLSSSKYLVQILASITGSLSIFSSGINLGWTSPYLPQLLNSNMSELSMTNNEGSWCAVMPLVGAPIGAVITAKLVDKIGRKKMILLSAPLVFVMFLVMACTKSVFILCAARFFIGSAEGALFTVLPMYYGEISSPEIRGIIMCTISINLTLGTLFINLIGLHYSIFVSSLLSALIPLVHFIAFLFMPESPYYCIKNKDLIAAKRNLQILRNSQEIDEELNLIIKAVTRQESMKKGRLLDLILVDSYRRATLIFIIVNVTKKISGKNPITFYTAIIFNEAAGSINPNLSIILYISIEILLIIIALFFIDRLGRRPLIIFSSIGCSISLAIECCYFYLKDQTDFDVNSLGWLPLFALICFNICYCVGLELAPVILLGELFPTNIKAIALAAGDTFSILNGTIVTKLFQITKDTVGMYLPFGIFSMGCAIGLVFIAVYVPETKSKSLEDIQILLMGYGGKKSNGVKSGSPRDIKEEPVQESSVF